MNSIGMGSGGPGCLDRLWTARTGGLSGQGTSDSFLSLQAPGRVMTQPSKALIESWCQSQPTLWTWYGVQRGLQFQASPFMSCRRRSQVNHQTSSPSQHVATQAPAAATLTEKKIVLRGTKPMVLKTSCPPQFPGMFV